MAKISEKGINLIKKFEGCQLKAYKDEVGVWTIGYGITNADKSITGTTIKSGLTISKAKAESWLESALNKKYVPLVTKYNAKYKWNQNELDALISFAYNIGSIDQLTANGTRSRTQIAEKILEYNKAGGKVYNGLTRRRKAERELFLATVTEEQKEEEKEIYYKKYTGKSVSLVDALKKVGCKDTSFENRKKIAKKNGISVYRGTEKQNQQLLRLLKNGRLKKV